ncbi:phosphotransferase family protein [Spirosoma endophyticum]|uniref:Predicted kinase, aminoglycoside phosphotransferase (APT) family n=1 Tax=Spirosoma endophyticum TaxID=662367 RepID=A0A1I1QMF8_9BACT|nr:aminoglycoside phosphotransferase family protein [Spirosoma endophyticum]SFD23162.1 Predicted kinase, aminoglycoside phosphotransferase (APT) family [Spirosoma endophyticum]
MLELFRTVIVSRFPELGNASFTLLTLGWDSIAVDVDDELMFKFPRDQEGIDALRREAAMLAVVCPKLTLAVPDLVFFDTPQPFSRHIKLKGDHLTTAQYELLDNSVKQRVAEELARFYAQLHAIDPTLLQAVGARPLDPWPTSEGILTGVQPHLSKAYLIKAIKTLDQWAHLADDPYGIIYGYFDGHGWNMAFDYERQQLAGVYDFGDAGFGELHQEFIYTNFISPDLTERVMTEYELITGYRLDRGRVSILTGVLRLVELAEMGTDPDYATLVLANALGWPKTKVVVVCLVLILIGGFSER